MSETNVQRVASDSPSLGVDQSPAPRDAAERTTQSVLVTLATYNERENLPELIAAIFQVVPHVHVLVIDDNSPDGTGTLADELSTADERVHVLHRAGKLGLGTATIAGMRYAIEHGYDFVLNMDADFSHHPRYIPALIAGMVDHDVMIGSRYVPGGGVPGWPLKRRLMSKAINTYARFLLWLPARDTSGAFRCYRVASLAKLDFARILSRGYSFQEEVLYWCRRAGCRFGETPIIFEDRRYGSSKINRAEAIAALWIIFRLGLFGR
jgi:dolichol-phosphate mannosyltransferase